MTDVLPAGRTTGSASEPYPAPATSMGRLFLDRVARTPNREAFRRPTEAGGWRSYTWEQTKEETAELAAGLLALGLGLEDRVAIASSTRLEWIFADIAIGLAGGANTTIYPNTMPEDVQFILSDSGSRIVFAEDATQLAKILEERDSLPDVATVVLMEGEGDGSFAISWEQLRALGREQLAADPGLVEASVARTGPDTLATLIYTSGTTGRPKGVELTHGNWTYVGAAVDALGILTIDDLQFLWLPLSHSFGKALSAMQLQIGFATAVDGRVPRIIDNLPHVRPTFMAAVPRIFEKLYAGIMKQAEGGGPQARVAGWGFGVAEQVAAKRAAGQPVTGALKAQHALADRLVYAKVRDRVGGSIRYFVSGSAALSGDLARFFDAIGLTILEGYGLTETSAITAVNRPENIGLGSVGQPMPGTVFRIADDGEILIKGPGVMRGYRNRPEADEEAFAPGDGWFASGDMGVIDDKGRLRITDRKKDLVKTSGGKYIAPGQIESMFKGETGLASAFVVIANERNYASALVGLDPDALAAFAQDHGLTGDHAGLSREPAVHEALQAAVDSLNSKLNRWETIKAFRVLDYVMDPDLTPDEVTPSLKIKRKAVEARNRELVDAMYSAG
jgi:long-chain acyl-CoA synthetase